MRTFAVEHGLGCPFPKAHHAPLGDFSLREMIGLEQNRTILPVGWGQSNISTPVCCYFPGPQPSHAYLQCILRCPMSVPPGGPEHRSCTGKPRLTFRELQQSDHHQCIAAYLYPPPTEASPVPLCQHTFTHGHPSLLYWCMSTWTSLLLPGWCMFAHAPQHTTTDDVRAAHHPLLYWHCEPECTQKGQCPPTLCHHCCQCEPMYEG